MNSITVDKPIEINNDSNNLSDEELENSSINNCEIDKSMRSVISYNEEKNKKNPKTINQTLSEADQEKLKVKGIFLKDSEENLIEQDINNNMILDPLDLNEYFITKALSLAVETSLVLDSKELAYRKSLADGVQNFISLLNHVAIKNYSGADKDKDFSGSYAADMLQSFFDRSYTCGSDSAKKAEPYIISMLEAIFEIPYIDYIISEAVKKNIINSINTCATKSLAGRSRKRKKKPKKNENTEKIPALTKAAKKYKKGKDQKESNKEIMKKLRTVLNDVIDDKIKNSNKKERNNFVKIFLEIGDNLKSELRRNRLLNETLFQNNIKNDLSVSDAEDRNINVHFDSSVSSIDRNETRENKELRIGFENTPESIESQENIDQNASDEIVFHNNMEIFVRMDKPKANY
ncbi:unnamed protein product [Parnassius mnemosyne]|uniref:Uncharacterized protein n=1 Tax=Parnassius mnemosyne TaxID=213953 RepID=A0AAV1LBE7_9NEOP